MLTKNARVEWSTRVRHAETMTNRPTAFAYELVGTDVVITHHGRRATTLRGAAGKRALADIAAGDPQEVMARLTGNYKRGNERSARNHPRNQGR